MAVCIDISSLGLVLNVLKHQLPSECITQIRTFKMGNPRNNSRRKFGGTKRKGESFFTMLPKI